MCYGDTYEGAIVANDPDGGPSPLFYYLVSFNGPGADPNVNAATGAITWDTEYDPAFVSTKCVLGSPMEPLWYLVAVSEALIPAVSRSL